VSTDVGALPFPHVAQAFLITRKVCELDGTRRSLEFAYGVTSLGPDQADPQRLAQLVRGHWEIENRLHWVRDVTFGEDRSQVRTRGGPRALAALSAPTASPARSTSPRACATPLATLSGRSRSWGCNPRRALHRLARTSSDAPDSDHQDARPRTARVRPTACPHPPRRPPGRPPRR
jgi:hypothetical protein